MLAVRLYRFLSQKFAPSVLLVMIVYQLGACPCGCLEHNAWLQLLGMSHEHVHSPSGSSPAWESEEHDCTGEARPTYVNNARQACATSAPGDSSSLVAFVEPPQSLVTPRFAAALWDSERPPRAHAPFRPALQVYLI